MKHRFSPLKIHLPAGFRFSAGVAGLKASGLPDLAFVETAQGTTAAAVFTKNRVVAAPLHVGRTHLARTRGLVRALIVNSGNANCATGSDGLRACQHICDEVANLLGIQAEQVFPSSTGIIGVPLPAQKIILKLPELIDRAAATGPSIRQFARAIMTTDTRPKLASIRLPLDSGYVKLLGIAKGSGMIHPQLATMLAYLFTDLTAQPAELRRLLKAVCDETFNCISVDGDTSTNDTVLLLASGGSGIRLSDAGVEARFRRALFEVCQSLAQQIVSDGEGVQHVIRLRIEQAKNRDEARRIAKAIAHSLLVKTAWAGADPNWGRILAAIGTSGVLLDPRCISILIGDQAVCRRGLGCKFDRQKAHAEMSKLSYEICVRLGRGPAAASYLTTDLTAEYVRINAEYST
jgi:glutamate N-acetyltransferase / amino-acid N-acetyltransferase